MVKKMALNLILVQALIILGDYRKDQYAVFNANPNYWGVMYNNLKIRCQQ